MRRWIAIPIFVVILIVAALLVLAIVLPRTGFIQHYKTQVATELSERLGTEVHLDGDIGVSIIPRLGLSVENVRIANPAPYEGSLAQVGRLKAQVQVLPLLRKEIKTGKITIDEPYIDYIIGADGVSNLQPILDRFQNDGEGAETEPAKDDGSAVAVAINGIDVRDGRVRFHNRKEDQRFEFGDLDIAVGAFDFNSQSSVQVGFSLISNMFAPQVQAQLESSLRMNLNRNQLFLDENTIRLDDERSTALIKAGLIALDLNAMQLVADSIKINAARGTFELVGEIDRLESTEQFSLFSVAGIDADLNDALGTGAARIDQAHYSTQDGRIEATGVEVDGVGQGVTVRLQSTDVIGALNGDQIVQVNNIDGAVKYGDLPYDIAIPHLQFNLANMHLTANEYRLGNNLSAISGSVALAIATPLQAEGRIDASAQQIRKLVQAALGQDMEAFDQLQSARVNGDWKLSGNSFEVKIDDGTLNDTELNGGIDANLDDMTGDVVVNLGHLVVDDYLPTSTAGGEVAAAKGDFVIPAVPTGFKLALTADEITYKAQNLRLEDLSIQAEPKSSTSADLALKGRLDIPGQEELIAAALSASVEQTREFLSITNLDALASNSQLSGAIQGEGLDIEMNTGDMRMKSPRIQFNASFLNADLHAPSFLYSVNSGSMALNDLVGVIENKAISANVNVADLNANINEQSLVSQSTTVRFSGAVAADAALHNVNFDMSKGNLKVGRVQMSGDSGQLDGRISLSNFTNIIMANADFAIKGNNLNIPLLAKQFGAEYSPAGDNALTNASLDLVGSYNAGDIVLETGHFTSDGGVIEATVQSESGVRNVRLNASNIDFSNWLPTPSSSSSQLKANTNATKAAVSPLALFFTDRSNGLISLSNITISGARLDAVDAQLDVNGSNMTLDPVSVTLYGGTSTATAHYNYDTGALRFDDALTQLALGDLLRDMEITSMFNGVGSLSFSGEAAAGNNPLLQRVDGNGEFSITDGELLGINFKRVLVEAYSLFNRSKGKEFSYDGNTGDSTRFASLTGKLDVSGGIANTDDIMLLAPALRVVGNGAYDLVNQSIDYTFTAYVDESFDGQGAEVDLASLTKGIPISVRGSVTSPKIGVDLQALYQKKIDAEVERAARKASDKLEEKIGGDASKVIDALLGTNISKGKEAENAGEAPERPAENTTSTTTDEPVSNSVGDENADTSPLPQAQTGSTAQTPNTEEPVDLREEAEKRLKQEAGKLFEEGLKGLF